MWKIEKIIKKGDYFYCIVRDHPRRTNKDYVLLHRVIVENSISRLLTDNEVIHHKDGNKLNNDISNLEILNSSIHTRNHNLDRGQLWVELKCPECHKNFNIPKNKSFLGKKGKWSCCSPSCRGKFSRKIQLYGITDQIDIYISKNLVREYRIFN